MGIPVVRVSSGGVAVTEASAGVPIKQAENGIGMPVVVLDAGGLPVSGLLSGFIMFNGNAVMLGTSFIVKGS